MRLTKQLGDLRCVPSALRDRVLKELAKMEKGQESTGLRKSMDFVKNAKHTNKLLASGLLDFAILCKHQMETGKLSGKSKADVCAEMDLTEQEMDQQLSRLV